MASVAASQDAPLTIPYTKTLLFFIHQRRHLIPHHISSTTIYLCPLLGYDKWSSATSTRCTKLPGRRHSQQESTIRVCRMSPQIQDQLLHAQGASKVQTDWLSLTLTQAMSRTKHSPSTRTRQNLGLPTTSACDARRGRQVDHMHSPRTSLSRATHI